MTTRQRMGSRWFFAGVALTLVVTACLAAKFKAPGQVWDETQLWEMRVKRISIRPPADDLLFGQLGDDDGVTGKEGWEIMPPVIADGYFYVIERRRKR